MGFGERDDRSSEERAYDEIRTLRQLTIELLEYPTRARQEAARAFLRMDQETEEGLRPGEKPLLTFVYVNWKGESHTYVIEPEGLEWTWGNDKEGPRHWMLHGMVVTRDNDPRPELGTNRRRSFHLEYVLGLKEIERDL